MDLDYMVYQLQYDSVHGRFPGTIEAREGERLAGRGACFRHFLCVPCDCCCRCRVSW